MAVVGMHHFERRKKQDLEPYPHPDPWVRRIDNCVYLISIMGIICTLPQAYTVLIEHNVAGVSLISWAWYTFASVFWFFYGIIHKSNPIIRMNICWIIIEGAIVVGIIMFR